MFIGKDESRKQYVLQNPDRVSKYELSMYFPVEFIIASVIVAFLKKQRRIAIYRSNYILVRRWCRMYPLRYRAHKIVFTAIRNGTLKAQPCSKCGEQKADAHHEDYNKPLEVVWLCRLCHSRHHQAIKYKKLSTDKTP